MTHLARALFCILLATATFFALVPGPLGQIIDSGLERHILAFLALPVLAGIAWPQLSIGRLWLAFAMFGGLIELAQLWMNLGRTAEWEDWLVDCLATSIALLAVYLIRSVYRPLSPVQQ